MIEPDLMIFAALAIGLLPAALLVLWVLWNRRTDKRRSPLTTVLHHLPGEQAQQQADRLLEAAGDRLIMAMLLGPLMLAGWALQKVDRHLLRFGAAEAILLVFVIAFGCWAAWSAGKRLRQRRDYLDGLAAERATAQALAPLTSKGCAIYHDIPTNKFNLDHVVVGPSTVFMIEAKSRRKPAA
ncbi:MAG TPA: nuclease-related domain-containing protein, partial [Phototrophicaceae bacterium]|nr:nuclease-related domain-containing protein [Phototrophicaceae bacterium]